MKTHSLLMFGNISIQVDTGRKLDVHKTFRRRPWRLLNVLCTFNLRPVSTGKFWLIITLRFKLLSFLEVMKKINDLTTIILKKEEVIKNYITYYIKYNHGYDGYVGCITNYCRLICFWFKIYFYKKPIQISHNFKGVLSINNTQQIWNSLRWCVNFFLK